MRYTITVVLFLFCLTSRAQESFAAALEITNVGIEIRLAGTEQWLSLSDGAVTAFGAGDLLRTNELGRVWLAFGENAALLVLPNSELRLDAYDSERLELSLQGTALMQATNLSGLLIHLQALDLIGLEGNAGLWSSPRQADIVTVAEGEALVRSGQIESSIET